MRINFDTYAAEVDNRYSRLMTDGNVDAFVRDLKAINARWIKRFAQQGYQDAGGTLNAKQAAESATRFINSYADGFGDYLRSDGFSPDRGRWRAFLYPNEGHKLGFILGQQHAMRERGARAWRRRLHPELSETGPCAACIEDSHKIHSMDEEFIALHVNEMCDVVTTLIYYPVGPEGLTPELRPIQEMPVPTAVPANVALIRKALQALGPVIQFFRRTVAEGEPWPIIPIPLKKKKKKVAPPAENQPSSVSEDDED